MSTKRAISLLRKSFFILFFVFYTHFGSYSGQPPVIPIVDIFMVDRFYGIVAYMSYSFSILTQSATSMEYLDRNVRALLEKVVQETEILENILWSFSLLIADIILGILQNIRLDYILTQITPGTLENSFLTPSFQEFLSQADGLDSLIGKGVHNALYSPIATEFSEGEPISRNLDYYKQYNMIDLQFEHVAHIDFISSPLIEALRRELWGFFLSTKGFLMWPESEALNTKVVALDEVFNVIDESKKQAGNVFKMQHRMNALQRIKKKRLNKGIGSSLEQSATMHVSDYLNQLKYRGSNL